MRIRIHENPWFPFGNFAEDPGGADGLAGVYQKSKVFEQEVILM